MKEEIESEGITMDNYQNTSRFMHEVVKNKPVQVAKPQESEEKQ